MLFKNFRSGSCEPKVTLGSNCLNPKKINVSFMLTAYAGDDEGTGVVDIYPTTYYGVLKAQRVAERVENYELKPLVALWKNYWIKDGLCLLFANTGVGKTTLAVQMGIEAARMNPDEMVLFFDLEMFEDEFYSRFVNPDTGEKFKSPKNFVRVEPDLDGEMSQALKGKKYYEMLELSIEMAVKDEDARIIIIDNLTSVNTKPEDGEEATKFMQWLRNVQRRYHLSILVVNHITKQNPYKPLEANDMAGSKRLQNATTELMAIGTVYDEPEKIYLKLFKRRGRDESGLLNSGLVEVFRRSQEGGLLHFEEEGIRQESDCLPELNNFGMPRRTQKIEEMARQVFELKSAGLTFREISAQLSISKSAASNYYRLYQEQNTPEAS